MTRNYPKRLERCRMEREDRVRRQSRSIYSRVRVAGVEFGILYESPRAADRNRRFLVRVTRRVPLPASEP